MSDTESPPPSESEQRVADTSSISLTGDYGRLNEILIPIIPDIPRLSEVHKQLANAKYIACFDLPRAFYQILMHEEDIPKTAIVIPGRKIEFLRAPFGFSTVPAHFQKQLNNILGSDHTWIYIDDLIDTAATFEDFINHIAWILKQCRAHNIRLSAKKSIITTKAYPIRIVGTIFHNGQRLPDPTKTEAITQLNFPSNITELRSFLGSINFLRDFIPNLASLRAPLDELLRKNSKYSPCKTHREAFDQLINHVKKIIPLTIPDDHHPLIMTTDASSTGIGAALFVELPPYAPNKPLKDRSLKPVSFFSRKLTKTQQNWPTIKQELFAIIESLRYEPHHEFLFGRCFELHTDHRNLLFLLNSSTSNPLIERWKPILFDYDFTMHHVDGPSNLWADLLSRSYTHQLKSSMATDNDLCLYAELDELLPHLDTQTLLNDTDLRTEFLSTIHKENAHLSKTRMLQKLKSLKLDTSHFKENVDSIIDNCGICQKFSSSSFSSPPLTGKLFSHLPFQSLHLDSIGPLQDDSDGNKYILVMTDAFTRFSILKAIPNITAETIANALISSVFCMFGLPESIRTDNGPEFDNRLFAALLKSLHIKHTFSYPHHHESNGLAERRNRDIRSTLNRFAAEYNNRANWSKLIPFTQLIINSFPCSSTGFAPFTLLFGANTSPRRNIIDHILSSPISNFKLDSRTKAKTFLLDLENTLTSLWLSAENQQDSFTKPHLKHEPLFKIGDLVLRKSDNKNKFIKHTGPFVVLEILGSNGYKIGSIVNDSSYNVSQYQLLPFLPNELNDNARTVAALDSSEFIVENITDHRIEDNQFLSEISQRAYFVATIREPS
ncbi:hypothetical protein P9112_005802 [Eukaryota sp. TZLM1-RC]